MRKYRAIVAIWSSLKGRGLVLSLSPQSSVDLRTTVKFVSLSGTSSAKLSATKEWGGRAEGAKGEDRQVHGLKTI